METQPAAKQKSYVGLYLGYEHASHPSISNQIGTNRIPVKKSIFLKGQNWILTYYRVGISRNNENMKKRLLLLFFWSCVISNSMNMIEFW